MKTVFFICLTVISSMVFCQANRKESRGKQPTRPPGAVISSIPATNTAANNQPELQPRQTATERYLNGSSRNGSRSASGGTNANAKSSTFVGGIHAADNATKTFDTATRNRINVNKQTATATISGGNDTTFNANTISHGGVTTNSGAVDRSGQAQFGQSNWGNGRRTVGESQWTVPPPITASFNKDFPASNAATWVRNNVDTTIFSARYKSGAEWVTASYNAGGQRLNTRTEYPLVQPPRPASVFIAKQPPGFQVSTISKIQVQGRPDVYEIHTQPGKTFYVNEDGMEVKY